ncbi:MAG TPA: hypothetical protein DEB31_10140 [Clostridiales bacterium]|nr:hypothetical protein [Clostridiales bacterium]
MPITDPVSSVYMNNMYVNGASSQQSSFGGVSAAANTNALGTTSTTNSAANTGAFSELLNMMMGMGTLSGIGDFSGTGGTSGSSYTDALMGMGGSSSLFGMGDMGGGNNMMMMMLLLLLASQNSNGQNNSLLSMLTGNTAANTNTSNTMNQMQPVSGYTSGNVDYTGIPKNPWEVANAALTNLPGQRSAATYRAVLNQFDVENNPRYAVNQKGEGDTYCNIYVWDATRAMGAEIPHYIDNTTGAPKSSGGAYISELTANEVNTWLNTHGEAHGWRKVSAEEAQYYANQGMPAVTSWKNPSGHGHLQMVSPSTDGQYNAGRGVAVAQAGRQLKNYDYIDTVYGSNTLSKVEYFVHV